MRKVRLKEATLQELRQFAAEVKGLPVSPVWNTEVLRSKILAVHSDEYIHLPDAKTPDGFVAVPESRFFDGSDDAPRPQVQMKAPKPATRNDDHKFVSIIIAKGEAKEDQSPVWVSVNGRGLWIERGKPQRIRMPYLRALQLAVRTVYHYDDSGQLVPEDVPSYPFQVLGEAA